MILSCAIVDDEPLAIALLEKYVEKTPFLSLKGKYTSAVNALEGLSAQWVDVLFLDIQMPELNGMEFSRMIDPRTRIIFTTAFSQYALESYKVNALDYLLKPIAYPDFLKASEKALQWHRLRSQASLPSLVSEKARSIFIKSDYRLVQIELEKILYVEGLKDYVKIFTEEKPAPIVSLMGMKEISELLPEEDFIRVHRSFIVRKDKIKTIERSRIVFPDRLIPVSDSYKETFAEFIASGRRSREEI